MKNKHEQKFSTNFNQIPKSFIREILDIADQRDMISFAGGLPNPDYFPVEALEVSAVAVFREYGKQMLQYAGSQGYLPLRQWIADRYSKKYNMHIKTENIVITNGSQQTIDIVSKLFINKGDGVIIEKPSYLGGIQALSAYSPTFLKVELEFDGPNTKQIELNCINHHPKFMYSIPNFQNPSGICYSPKKRRIIAQLAKEYNLIILEDDPYNEIRFNGEDLKPMFCEIPDQVFWTGSFSKMVAPGLRMGWVIVPDGMAPYFVRAKQSTDLHSNNLSQYILHHYLTHNNIDNHLKKIRIAYKKQCYFMQEMIQKYLPANVKFTRPDGGMFIWLTLPLGLSSEELINKCLKQGLAFVPGKSFFTTNEGEQNIRMNFSNSNYENIEKGLIIMAKEINKLHNKKVSIVN